MNTKKTNLVKKVVIGILVFAVVMGLLIGIIWIAVSTGRASVLVIEVAEADYGYDVEMSNTLEGTISTGMSQEVTTDMGTKVEKILVTQGQQVTEGQELMRFDSTEASLELQQANINLQGYQVTLSNAQKKLDEINRATEFTQTITVSREDTEDDDEAEVEDDSDIEIGEDSETGIESDTKQEKKASEEETDPQQQTTETVYRTEDGSVYTAEELRQEKSELSAEIAASQTDIKEAVLEIERAQRDLDACTVKAELSGYVTKVADVSTLNSDNVILRVSAMDGLYVNSALSEWMLDTYGVGDTVYVTDWLSGSLYETTITFVSTYDSSYYSELYNDYSGSSASYYPFTAIITDEGANLKSGDNVEVSFSYETANNSLDDFEDTEDSIYLLKAFVLSENGKKYVYLRDENDRLKKQEVTVGKQSEDTIEIKDGLSSEDYIAFPYGKNVRVGAKTKEGTIDDLYED